MDISKLDELYHLYRFELLPLSNSDIRVYSLTNRYYSNADVIILNKHLDNSEIERFIKGVQDLGYSTERRFYSSISEAEDKLFDGFFDIEISNRRLLDTYNSYKKKVEDVTFGEYSYINADFIDEINGSLRSDSIIDQIINDFKQPGPVLIMLEAAAGFGKTSTSYEVLKQLVSNNSNKIPLFSELSRNRQASIFKYVLYDEINRQFAGPSLELITKHIIDGRIPLIIDGFDELLKPKRVKEQSEEKFEDAEPMLETIKELLKGEAKIILTTRRTAILSDGDFGKWVESNENNFTFKQYSINEPSIRGWISAYKEKELKKVGLNLKSIANPVLLSYIRSLNDEEFDKCLKNIDQIINTYMEKLMTREIERQDLTMSVNEQKNVLKGLSKYFYTMDITSEGRDVLEKRIIEENAEILVKVSERYSSSQKPSIEQIANKIIIHAFLDKKGDNGQQIGFVNEFILGSFVGVNLLEEGDSWIASERFLDFILTSYIPRDEKTKIQIYEILNKNIIELLPIEKQVFIDNYLFGSINRLTQNAFISDMEFRNKFANNVQIKNVFFSECEFYNISFDFSQTNTISFINCAFYDCSIDESDLKNNIDFTNCTSNNQIDFNSLSQKIEASVVELAYDDVHYERKVLEKFWPTGKERFTPHKRPGTLRLGIPPEEIENVHIAIESLIRRKILIERKGHHSLELNIEHIIEIKRILGR